MAMELNEHLHPDLVTRVPDLADRFRTASPFRFVAIDNFFKPELADRLAAQFP
ncbi:MAG: 2OG-Fe(II) oxygenase, partial [Xanthomonadales bacterium]|nr:2OG-Fe(II) oxygenase [Xanthomonadales bacterium]